MQKAEGRGALSVITLGFMVTAVMDGALLYDMARAGTGDRERRHWETRREAGTAATARARARGVRSERSKDDGRNKVLW